MNKLKSIFQTLFNKTQIEGKLEKSNIQGIFSEIEDVQIKKQRMRHYLEELNIKEEVYKQYEYLDENSVAQINTLAQKAKEIESKKQNLKGRLISHNAALSRLAKYEDQVPDMIKEMKVAEKRRRETESHMLYLQEERILLTEERESLLSGYSFLKVLSLMIIIITGVCLIASFIMLQILREKIWFILSGMVIFGAVSMVAIILIKEKLEKEIKKNGMLQQKAAKYLNKSKIRFFNQTQYLEFQYHKLGVDSVSKLELYYNRYLRNKNNERMYLQMNEALLEIEEKIIKILHNKGILLQDIEDLSDWILQPKGVNELKHLQKERIKTKEKLQAFIVYEQEMWKELELLAENEETRTEIEACLAYFSGKNRLDKIPTSA